MKTKTNQTTNQIASGKSRRLTSKRKALLESYFSNAVVLAALLESAQNELKARQQLY